MSCIEQVGTDDCNIHIFFEWRHVVMCDYNLRPWFDYYVYVAGTQYLLLSYVCIHRHLKSKSSSTRY